jgi:hypothetical protein
MELSLKEFKERFNNHLIEIHWRHWAALGVSTHIKPERYWAIDLEPLIISTLAIGLRDKRLLSASLEWLIKNGEWVNLSRLKRILNFFGEPFPGMQEDLITPEIFALLVDVHNKNTRNKITYKKDQPYRTENDKMEEYKSVFKNFKVRNVVTEPNPRDPSMLQILLRGFFGIDAHVETFIYLLINDSGNSNFIAKEIFYNQKNVYSILKRWANARVVTKVSGNKAASYSLNRRKELLTAVGLKVIPRYINWTSVFTLLDRLAVSLSTPPWSEDEYLLSSFFRDLFSKAESIARLLNIKVPNPVSHSGKQYFSPFASVILKILRQLRKGT